MVDPRRAIVWTRLGAPEIPRIIAGLAMLLALFLGLKWMQIRFDTSDQQRALELVKEFRAPPKATTIPQLIAAKHPYVKEGEIEWSSEILSGCLGTVRVYALVPKRGSHTAITYAFDVSLTDPSIHPTDPRSTEIIKALPSAVGGRGKGGRATRSSTTTHTSTNT